MLPKLSDDKPHKLNAPFAPRFIDIKDLPSVNDTSTSPLRDPEPWITLCDIVSDESVRRPTFLVRDRNGDTMYVEFVIRDEEMEEKLFDLVKVGYSFSLLNPRTRKQRGHLISVDVNEKNIESVQVGPLISSSFRSL